MKLRSTSFMIILSLCSVLGWGQNIVETWNLSSTMTATLDSEGLLTVFTTESLEAMPIYEYKGAPWNDVLDNIRSAVIKDNITSIGDWAFSECGNLSSIVIPNSVISIGNHAFSRCYSLASVTIPSLAESIGVQAFFACFNLASLTIPSSVSFIDYSQKNSPFDYCHSLTSINVDANNINYSSEDGILYNKDKTVLCTYPPGKSGSSFSIPASVTSIGDGAFVRCSNLSSVIIPNSVTSIGDYAFFDFQSLTSVTIPNSVTSIGIWAFAYCASLKDITVNWTTPLSVPQSEDRFSDVDKSNITLHVPIGTIALYEADPVWGTFGMIDDGATVEKSIHINDMTNGTVTSDCISAVQGEIVTLTIIPNLGYELSSLTVTNDNDGSTVPLNVYSFTMPDASVTISATFSKTNDSDEEAVENAVDIIISATISVTQTDANTEASVSVWLEDYFNNLLSDLNVTITITYTSFTPAITGTLENPNGVDGSFTIKVLITTTADNSLRASTDVTVYGIIEATKYIGVGTESIKNVVPSAYTANDILYISGLYLGEAFSLYNIQGQLIYKGIAKNNEEQVSLSTPGIYILTTNDRRLKIKH